MKDVTIHINRPDASLNISKAKGANVCLEMRIDGVTAETTVPIKLFESFRKKK